MRLYSVYSEYLLNCTVKLRIGVDGACVYFVLAGVQGIQHGGIYGAAQGGEND